MNSVVRALQQFVSGIIMSWFLTAVFLASMWHNWVTVHFHKKPDPRDLRGPQDPRDMEDVVVVEGQEDLEIDRAHNVVYDHIITLKKKKKRGLLGIGKSQNKDSEKIEKAKEVPADSTPNGNAVPDEDATPDSDIDPETNIDGTNDVNNNETNNNTDPPPNTENPYANIANAEDRKLNPDLNYYYKQYGINVDYLKIETEDGFILELMHFTPLDKKEAPPCRQTQTDSEIDPNTSTAAVRPPILLLHGLLQHSGAYASPGRNSLAYYFYQSGFDVWLGNNRCGFHPEWNKEKLKDKQSKWDWNIYDMVKYDLKTMITFILDHTNYTKLSLVAHSQGTAESFLGLIHGEDLYKDDPDGFLLKDKLKDYIALAPALYPGPILFERVYMRFMSWGIDSPWIFGTKWYIFIMSALRRVMVGGKMFSFFSYLMFNYMFNWNDALWEKGLRNRHFMFSPVYVSVKLMRWWIGRKKDELSFRNNSKEMFPSKRWFSLDDDDDDDDDTDNGVEVNDPVDNTNDNNVPAMDADTPNNAADDTANAENVDNPVIINEDNADNADNTDNANNTTTANVDTGAVVDVTTDTNNNVTTDTNNENDNTSKAEKYPNILLFIPKQDRLVDGKRVLRHFINYESPSVYKAWYIDEYSHVDVLWAKDVIERVGKRIVDNLR